MVSYYSPLDIFQNDIHNAGNFAQLTALIK